MRTAAAILALSVVCQAASRDERTQWFREAIREQLQQVEKHMAAPNAEPTTRDLPNAALATLMLAGDARKAEQLIVTMYSHQDMDTASPGYGTIPWQVGHPEIRDANSIEFCTQPIGPMLKGYGKLLSTGFIEKIKPNLQAAFTAIRRHKVAVTYTNIFLMKTVNLILAGEAIGDAQAAADGYSLLDQWIEHTRVAGVGEFDSPNYYAVNLNSLLMGYRYAARPGAKDKFKALLDFFWSDIAANFFEPRGSLSGPHSRGYDFLGGHESVELFLYQEGLRKTPPSSTPSIGRIYLLENEKPGGYRPGTDILALARLPQRIVQSRWRAEAGRERYNFITPNFAIGSTSGHYGTHDKLINIELAAPEELPAIYIAPDITDAPYGRQRFKDKSGHGKPVHVPLNAVSVQSEGRILVLLDLNPSTLAETGTFATNVVIPANADQILLEGERYSAKAPFKASGRIGSTALVRTEKAAVAIRLFAADGAAGYKPEVILQADVDGLPHGAARFSVYHYRGGVRKLSEEHVRVGLLIEAAQCDTEASVKALLARVSEAKIDHSSDGSVWSAKASVGGVVLESARDMAKGQPAYRRINGKDAPGYVLNVNGKHLARPLPAGQDRNLPATVLEDKIRGGLLGQIIANLNGLKHENKYVGEPGKVESYVPSLPDGGWTDDDTDIEWVYLFGMERANTILLPRERIAEMWRAHINQRIWCSHRYLRQLMNLGIEPPLTGSVHLNPWASFNLSGQFVSESWGLISPGMPRTASRIGVHYLHTSIDGEPVQAAQMFAAMVSAAFFTNDMERIFDTGAASIDPKSQMASVLADVRRWHKEYPNDWQAVRTRIRDKYTLFPGRVDQRDLNGVILNGAATLSALLYGGGDFVETVRHAFNFGWDADNTAATSGTIVGVIKGHKGLTSQGWIIGDAFRNTSRDGLPDETITTFGDRLIRLAEKVILSEGGRKTAAGFIIPVQKPAMVEPLADFAAQLDELRNTLGPQIEKDVVSAPHEQAAARAAYLAIALDLGTTMQQKHPKQWKHALECLSGYAGLTQLLFYDSPGETGERLRRQALAAGLPQPAKRK